MIVTWWFVQGVNAVSLNASVRFVGSSNQMTYGMLSVGLRASDFKWMSNSEWSFSRVLVLAV